jgi:cbb3-type cytochrome oxidase subunit 3
MMKDTVRALSTGSIAEIGLLAFLLAFILILIYTFTLSKSVRDRASQQPLDDDDELPTQTTDNL